MRHRHSQAVIFKQFQIQSMVEDESTNSCRNNCGSVLLYIEFIFYFISCGSLLMDGWIRLRLLSIFLSWRLRGLSQ